MTIRVLVVENHSLVRRGIEDVLDSEQSMEVVGEADGAEGALELFGRLDPDVALVDPGLGGGTTGLELCRRSSFSPSLSSGSSPSACPGYRRASTWGSAS